jgi:ribosomal-protein-alanine N-acetyltransferase
VADAAFGDLELHRASGRDPEQRPRSGYEKPASARRLARRHLQIAGVWQDHKLYAVTAEEWPPSPDAGSP